MLAIEICALCKYFDDEDLPNLWCKKINDFINGSEMKDLASAGCHKIETVLRVENLLLEESEKRKSEVE